MEAEVAEAVADELGERDEVTDTSIEQYDDVVVKAYVDDREGKSRLKPDLGQYPIYIEIVLPWEQ